MLVYSREAFKNSGLIKQQEEGREINRRPTTQETKMTLKSSFLLRIATAVIISSTFIQRSVAAAELCQDCSARRAMLTDAELTEIRIEHIKQMILKKLRMTEPPKVGPNIITLETLPEPLRLPNREAKSNDDDNNYDDDFYGKLEEIVLFPTEGGCDPSTNLSTTSFVFQLPNELEGYSVKSAEFWLRKEKIELEESKNTVNAMTEEEEYVITEEANSVDNNETMIFTQRILIGDAWAKADVSQAVKMWQQGQNGKETNHSILVSFPSSRLGTRPSVSCKANEKPFLVINMYNYSKSRRQKRNINCAPGIEECCRENLNISFAALGWDEWIFSPAYYNAYHCKGTCLPPSSVTSGNYYHSIIKKYTHQNPDDKVVSCCTAEKFSGLDIIYMNQGVIHKQVLPNMIVESCGCV